MAILRLNSLKELVLPSGSRKSRSKHGNVHTKIGGEKYDSKREATRHLRLELEQRAGRIANLRRQVPFVLAPKAVVGGKPKRSLIYRADFVYERDGKTVVEDSKGHLTEVYKIKRHLMKTVHGIDILET